MPSFYIAFPLSFLSFLSLCPSLSFYSSSASIQYSSNNFILLWLCAYNTAMKYVLVVHTIHMFIWISSQNPQNFYGCTDHTLTSIKLSQRQRDPGQTIYSRELHHKGYLFDIYTSPILCKCVQKSTGLINLEKSYQIRGISYIDKKVLKALKSNNRKKWLKIKVWIEFFLKKSHRLFRF